MTRHPALDREQSTNSGAGTLPYVMGLMRQSCRFKSVGDFGAAMLRLGV